MKRVVGSASPMLRRAAPAAAFATLYFLTAALTEALIEDPGLAVLWPASGVYLGVMLVAPHRMWTALACGAGIGSLAAYLHGGSSFEVSVAFAVPSSAEGLLGALLVERIAGGRFKFEGLRDLYALVVGSAVVAIALVGLSAGAVAAQTFQVSFVDSWLRWWSADALGVIAVTPIITASLRAPSRWQVRDVMVVFAGVGCGVTYAAWSEPAGAATLIGGAITLPFLLLAGWRWGPRAAAVGGLGVALVATHVAAQGTDLVTGAADLGGQVYLVQAFLAVLLLSSLAFAAVAGDDERLRDELARAKEGSAGELDQARRWSAQLAAELAARNAELAHNASRLEQVARGLEDSHDARERTEHELGGATSALAVANQEIAGLRRELSLGAADRDRMRGELDDSARGLQSLQTKLRAAADERAQSRADSRALKEALESARRDGRALEAELDRARANGRALQAELERARADSHALEQELDSARADSRAGEQALDSARSDSSALQAELERARVVRRTLEEKLDSAHADGQARANELERLRATRGALGTELESARAEQARTAAELAEAVACGRRAEHELELVTRRVDALTGELRRAQRDHEQAELALEHARARFAKRQEHLQRALEEANVKLAHAESGRDGLADRANELYGARPATSSGLQ
jgi:integral membrane sensor domain MASE1/predicted  nucleic acid-binding Zn-ribbon protein